MLRGGASHPWKHLPYPPGLRVRAYQYLSRTVAEPGYGQPARRPRVWFPLRWPTGGTCAAGRESARSAGRRAGIGQCGAKLSALGDAELGEHLAQVPLNRARAGSRELTWVFGRGVYGRERVPWGAKWKRDGNREEKLNFPKRTVVNRPIAGKPVDNRVTASYVGLRWPQSQVPLGTETRDLPTQRVLLEHAGGCRAPSGRRRHPQRFAWSPSRSHYCPVGRSEGTW